MTKHLMVALAFSAALCAPVWALAQTSDAGAKAEDVTPTAPTLPTVTAGEATIENPAEIDPIGAAQDFYKAIRSSEWIPAFGLGLMLLVAAVRWGGSKISDWFTTRTGGYVVALTSAFGVTFGAALNAGQPFSWSLFAMAIGIAWTASGGYDTFRDVIKNK